MASFEGTALDRMTSDISRFSAISSLVKLEGCSTRTRGAEAYSELDVARSTCSSIWEVDANQPAIMSECVAERQWGELFLFDQYSSACTGFFNRRWGF